MLSVLDLFRIGIGPSSSHTVGPMRIARRFVTDLKRSGKIERTTSITVELQGSLALTGAGHAAPKAVMLGLLGLKPETLDPDSADARVAQVETEHRIQLCEDHSIAFDPQRDIVFAYDSIPDLHPNGMEMSAFDTQGEKISGRTYYSTGGGFIASRRQFERPAKNDVISTSADAP
jgi:L-serine dehydratase